MAEVGVALAWIAISVASAKGLAALARAAMSTEVDREIADGRHEELPTRLDLPARYRVDPPADPLGVCP